MNGGRAGELLDHSGQIGGGGAVAVGEPHSSLQPPNVLLKSTTKPIVRGQEDTVHYDDGQGESQKFHSVYLLGASLPIHMGWRKS